MPTIRLRGSNQVLLPAKIFCLGRNYAEHAREMQAEVSPVPVIFLKPRTAVISDGEQIVIPRISKQVHHEVELVVAIGTTGKHIPRSKAFDHVLGYGVGLDMTLRDIQTEAKNRGLPWTVAKGFDTSAPVSDIVPAGEIGDPHAVTISCRVNGAQRQRSSTAKMVFRIDEVIEFISSIFTLEAGDLIFTGTPEGASEVHPGDTVEAELVGFTKTSHRVEAE